MTSSRSWLATDKHIRRGHAGRLQTMAAMVGDKEPMNVSVDLVFGETDQFEVAWGQIRRILRGASLITILPSHSPRFGDPIGLTPLA